MKVEKRFWFFLFWRITDIYRWLPDRYDGIRERSQKEAPKKVEKERTRKKSEVNQYLRDKQGAFITPFFLNSDIIKIWKNS